MSTLQPNATTETEEAPIDGAELEDDVAQPNNTKREKGAIWRALRHRNYRLFFFGQIISLVGSWMTQLAMSWLVYRLTKSPLLLGLTGFAGQIPTFVIAPFAGVWLDRQNRHRVLVCTQTLAMIQSLALAALAITGIIQIWHIIALAVFQGLVNAFDMPARQAFVVEMVEDRADLNNAIALNSSMVNPARLIGPALAAVVIARSNEGYCFLIDGLSYIAVIGSLLMMRIKPREIKVRTESALQSLRGGLQYINEFKPIRAILLSLAFISLTGMSYMTLMPVIVGNLHGNAGTQGTLMIGSGIGALSGALYLASKKNVLGLGQTLIRAPAMLGLGLFALSLSHSVWLSFLVLMLTGCGTIGQITASNTLVQTLVEEDKRSRVMSFYTVAFLGMSPFGSLLAGALTHRFGVESTLKMASVCCLLASLWFSTQLPALRQQARPRLEKLGILPAKG